MVIGRKNLPPKLMLQKLESAWSRRVTLSRAEFQKVNSSTPFRFRNPPAKFASGLFDKRTKGEQYYRHIQREVGHLWVGQADA